MNKITVYGAMMNGGDGSVSVMWYLSHDRAEEEERNQCEGWGETCVCTVETYEGSNVHKEAIENENDDGEGLEDDDEDEDDDDDVLSLDSVLAARRDQEQINQDWQLRVNLAVKESLKALDGKWIDGTSNGIFYLRVGGDDVLLTPPIFSSLTREFVVNAAIRSCGFMPLNSELIRFEKAGHGYALFGCYVAVKQDSESKPISNPIVKLNPKHADKDNNPLIELENIAKDIKENAKGEFFNTDFWKK